MFGLFEKLSFLVLLSFVLGHFKLMFADELIVLLYPALIFINAFFLFLLTLILEFLDFAIGIEFVEGLLGGLVLIEFFDFEVIISL